MRLQFITVLIFFITIFNVTLSLAKSSLEKRNIKENVLTAKNEKPMTSTKRDNDHDVGGQDDPPISGPQKKREKDSGDSSSFSRNDHIWAIFGVLFGVAIIVVMAVIAVVGKPKPSPKGNKRSSKTHKSDSKSLVLLNNANETPQGSPSSFNQSVSLNSSTNQFSESLQPSFNFTSWPSNNNFQNPRSQQNFEEIPLN